MTIMEIYNQDCISGMVQHLRDKSVDVVVTSPPYNIGARYSIYNDNLTLTEYLEFIEVAANPGKAGAKEQWFVFSKRW